MIECGCIHGQDTLVCDDCVVDIALGTIEYMNLEKSKENIKIMMKELDV